MVLRVVVLGVVHAHHDGDILAFCGGGDDDFLATRGDMPLGFIRLGKETCRLNYVVDPEVFPGKCSRTLFDCETFDFVSIHDEKIIFGDGGGRFRAGDVEVEAPLGGVVFDEVGQIVCRHQVVNRHHIKFLS